MHIEFGSHDIEDAEPPSCDINFNGTYILPKNMPNNAVGQIQMDGISNPLPSCFVMDSRKGYHTTYYWFYLLEWQWQ
jgi:hypothetical protein